LFADVIRPSRTMSQLRSNQLYHPREFRPAGTRPTHETSDPHSDVLLEGAGPPRGGGGPAPMSSCAGRDIETEFHDHASMGIEIEKKFLVISDAWKRGAHGTLYRQGYLSTDPARTVRVRLQGQQGKLTIKGRKVGDAAPEFEYDIAEEDARFLLENLCLRPLVEKTRYEIRAGDDHVWEVDEFHGANDGLVIAEIELDAASEPFDKPDWVGKEVTSDSRYTNARLVQDPFSTWIDR
jgi:adenylate cyclase